jgi:flagellar hook-associated protein 3 FlgL
MIRVSTANAFSTGVDTLQMRQRELSDAQAQLVSGKRVAKPSDDPTGAARAERALASIARAEANQRALDASRNAMTLSEAALGDGIGLLQQAREALVASGNGSWSAEQRRYAAEQIAGLRDQLLSVANRDNGAGGYLFGGQDARQRPFDNGAGGAVQWVGVSGAQVTASDEPLPLTMDGQVVWLQAASGNGVFETDVAAAAGSAWIDAGRVRDPSQVTGQGYDIVFDVGAAGTTVSVLRADGATVVNNAAWQAGQEIAFDGIGVTLQGEPADGDRFRVEPSQQELSVFDALDRAVAVLSDPDATASQVTQAVKFGLRDVDAVMSNMNSRRADAGAWLNRIDNVEDRISQVSLQSETERSNAEDLDMVQAVSDFQAKQSSYDAALRTYGMVQRLSLFQYLGS